MKRRRFLQAIAATPALALPAEHAVLPQQSATPVNPPSRPVEEGPKLEFTVPDASAKMAPHYFNAQQFAALRKLSDILMPAINGAPGALETSAPEFLDFLIGKSPTDRQQLYRTGLDTLNAQATTRFNQPFAEVAAAQAGVLLAPLRQHWTFEPPADPLARFLREAQQDVRLATMNSREWNSAAGHDPDDAVDWFWYPFD